MPNLVKYELPPVVVHPSRSHLEGVARVFDSSTHVVSLPASPGSNVCPVGLEVDPDVAPHLLVVDIRVGKNSQLCSVGCVPSSLFATSPPARLVLDRVRPGCKLTLVLACAGPEAVTFRGSILALPPTSPREVESPPPRAAGSYVVGLGCTEVAAGETVDVVVFPQVELRLRRLHVPRHLLDAFRVDGLYQGRYLDVERASQADPSHLGTSNLARGGEVELEPCAKVGVGCPVTLRVTNTSGVTRQFTAALLGDPVRRVAE